MIDHMAVNAGHVSISSFFLKLPMDKFKSSPREVKKGLCLQNYYQDRFLLMLMMQRKLNFSRSRATISNWPNLKSYQFIAYRLRTKYEER